MPDTKDQDLNVNKKQLKVSIPAKKKESNVPLKPTTNNNNYTVSSSTCVCNKGLWCEECLGEYDDLLD